MSRSKRRKNHIIKVEIGIAAACTKEEATDALRDLLHTSSWTRNAKMGDKQIIKLYVEGEWKPN